MHYCFRSDQSYPSHEIMDLSSLTYQGDSGQEEQPAVLLIEHDKASASIAEVGATLTSWQPAGQKAVLFTSPSAQFMEGKAVRGGVPVCWPWFGPHRNDDSLPQHGLVRTRTWDLIEGSEDENGVQLVFEPSDSEGLPDGVSVRYELQIGETLTLKLITTNSSEDQFRLSQALHAYFAIGDLTVARIFGLDDAAFDDALAGYTRRKQRGTVDLEDAIDSVFYPIGNSVTLEDPAWKRKIRIEFEGSHSLVVWNPGRQGAAKVSDLRPEDYVNFVCIEPANALQNDQIIPAGGRHSLKAVISVEANE